MDAPSRQCVRRMRTNLRGKEEGEGRKEGRRKEKRDLRNLVGVGRAIYRFSQLGGESQENRVGMEIRRLSHRRRSRRRGAKLDVSTSRQALGDR